MNWKTKSLIQRACAALPFASEPVYYAVQRRFGNLRRVPDPKILLEGVVSLEQTLRRNGRSFAGARVFEVGTGRRLDMPIGFHLLGARSVATADLHRYLRPELVAESLEDLRADPAAVRSLFDPLGPGPDFDERLERVCGCSTLDELGRLIGLEYLAPADARRVDLPAGSFDLHVSYTVFEHIPGDVLVDILRESERLLAPNGAALHHVDLSDHFAHSDPSIPWIHFLRYPERKWRRFNENQFAYHNRLRVDAYDRIYEEAGQRVLDRETYVQPDCRRLLDDGFPLAPEFAGMDPDLLATTVARYLSQRG